jgi:hypothetical protein
MLTGFLGVETSHSKDTQHRPGSLETVSSEAAAAWTLRLGLRCRWVWALGLADPAAPERRPTLPGVLTRRCFPVDVRKAVLHSLQSGRAGNCGHAVFSRCRWHCAAARGVGT